MHARVKVQPFIGPLFAMAGAIAKSDGRVSEQEIAATENLMTRMQMTPDQRASAIERFSAGKQAGFAVDQTIAELRAWASGRRDLAFLLLDMLLDVVYAEGPLSPNKFMLVRKLCASLGVHERELAALAAMRGYAYAAYGAGAQGSYRGGSGQDAPRQPAEDAGFDSHFGLSISAIVLRLTRDVFEGMQAMLTHRASRPARIRTPSSASRATRTSAKSSAPTAS